VVFALAVPVLPCVVIALEREDVLVEGVLVICTCVAVQDAF